MKFQASLNQKFFQPMPPISNGYRWEDVDTDRVRVISKDPCPWDKPMAVIPSLQFGKSDSGKYLSRLELKVFPLEELEQLPEAVIERDHIKAHFPSYKQPCLFFAAFPLDSLLWVQYAFVALGKQLYLIRGASGSGKTTLAQSLCANRVVCADDFPGLYKGGYRLELQEQAHQWCLAQTEAVLHSGKNIAVANTFSRRRHLLPYLELSKKYGYRVSIVTCEGNHGSIHDVPEEVRDRQLATYEPLETGSLKALEIRLHDTIKKGVATPQQLHELIDRLTASGNGDTAFSSRSQAVSSQKPPVPNLQPKQEKSAEAKRGKGEFLEAKTNEERISESIQLVSEAVAELQAQNRWNKSLTKRDRIKLIQEFTRAKYNRTISTGTLYRDWCKPIWSGFVA